MPLMMVIHEKSVGLLFQRNCGVSGGRVRSNIANPMKMPNTKGIRFKVTKSIVVLFMFGSSPLNVSPKFLS